MHQVLSGRSRVPLLQPDCTELPGERPTVGRHRQLAETTAISDDSEAARASHTTMNDRRPVALRIWNDLPADIVSAPSLAIFKQRLKTHLSGQSFT